MSGTNLQRVHYVNANWTPKTTADAEGSDSAHDTRGAGALSTAGRFGFLVVTEDGVHHELHVSAAEAGPLIELTQASNALLWDPDSRSLIAANLVGQSVQDTLLPTPPPGVPELHEVPTTP